MRFAALVTAGLVMLSCGDDREKPAPVKKPLTKVQVLIDWKAEPTYAGFFLAKERGFYEARGLDVQIVEGSGATVSAQAIGAGSEYFIGSCSGAATAIARSKGVPIKSLAVLYPNTPTVLFSRADTPIRVPADLLGKRVGLTTGSINVDEYRGVIAANNIDRSKIEEVAVGWDVTPLLTKKVDGLMNYEELTPVQLRLQGHDIAVMRFAEHGVNVYSLNLIVNERALQEKSEVVRGIVAGTVEGYSAVKRDPASAAALFSRLFPERDKDFVRESMIVVARLLGSGEVGKQNAKGWHQTIETLSELGLLDGEVAAADVAAEDYLGHE